jgi:aminoglycoside phosphotransferase (APT) family kinase protein
VLRRPPDGDLPAGARDMAREHRLLSRLSRVQPVAPDSLHFCADVSVLGAPFQRLEFRPGVVFTGANLPSHAPADAPQRLSSALVETLAAIHAVDPRTCGLEDLGRPEGFLERTIAGWRARGARIADGRPVGRLVEDISGWLINQQYRARPPALLHMDFKLDNLLLDVTSLGVNAVLDWDMGTRGDSLFDLAILISYWFEPGEEAIYAGLDQMPTASSGFWTRERAASHYSDLKGHDTSDLPALRVLALLRLGVVFLQLHGQFTSGAASSPCYGGFDRCAEKILVHALEGARTGLP